MISRPLLMQNEVLKPQKKLKDGQSQRSNKNTNNLCTDMGNINATTPQVYIYILCLYVP